MTTPQLTTERPIILYVDDDDTVHYFLSRALNTSVKARGLDPHLIGFYDGKLLVEAAKTYNGQVKLVITDFKMPGMNGIEVIANLSPLVTKAASSLSVYLMSTGTQYKTRSGSIADLHLAAQEHHATFVQKPEFKEYPSTIDRMVQRAFHHP
jgi:CheY-like chemotaxis protein